MLGLTPKLGLALICKYIEKQLDKKIDSYEIWYIADGEQFFVRVDGEKYHFDNKMVQKQIKERYGTVNDDYDFIMDMLQVVYKKGTDNDLESYLYVRQKDENGEFQKRKLRFEDLNKKEE